MADQKISELNPLAILAGNDLIPVVDVDEAETKNITKTNLMASPGPIGGTNPNTGEFTTIELTLGATVDEISTDVLFAASADDQLSTALAIKTYVDAQTSGGMHNDLGGLQGGDSTSEFYHLTAQIHNQISSDSTSVIFSQDVQVLGDLYVSEDTIFLGTGEIKSSAGNVELYYDSVKALETTTNGFLVGADLEGSITHDSTDLTIKNTQSTGLMRFVVSDGSERLRGFLSTDVQEIGTTGGTRLRLNPTNADAFLYGSDNDYIWIRDRGTHHIEFYTNSKLAIDCDDGSVDLYYEDDKEAETISGGFKATNSFQVASSQAVDEISNDQSLSGDSTTVLVTEQAIKAYVDSQIAQEVITGQEVLVDGDSTGSVVFSSAEADTNYSISYSLVNTVDSLPSMYGSIVTEKTVNGFTVTLSGALDSDNYTLDWTITR